MRALRLSRKFWKALKEGGGDKMEVINEEEEIAPGYSCACACGGCSCCLFDILLTITSTEAAHIVFQEGQALE